MQLGAPDTDVAMVDAFELGAAAALASVASAAADPIPGQQRGWRRVPACPSTRPCSFDVSACAVCCVEAADSTRPHRDVAIKPDGHDTCVICSHQIAKTKQGRPHGAGRAHQSCIKALGRATAATSTVTPRTKRPYESLKPTQRWERRTKARAAVEKVLDDIGCPLSAITRPVPVTPTKVIHLSPAERHRTRSIRPFLLPSERSVRKRLLLYATTHATETGTFANGSYITDPLRYVSVLCAQATFLAVGGDCGGGHCKLGITFGMDGKQHFAALLVSDGGDQYEDLRALTVEGTTRFVGASACFTNIFQILQHLIDTQNAFLNGDWLFLNVVLGLKNANAKNPCPICIVSDASFLRSARYRLPADKHSLNPHQPALLIIASDRIVPTPLHVFLGISNRIIMKVFPGLFGEEPVLKAVRTIKTIHSAGCGGLSDLWDLNGQEITKWVKKERSSSLLAAVEATAEARSSHSILSSWLVKMHHSLLHAQEWTTADIDSWRATVTDIHQHWVAETGIAPFPKLHMLHHTVDFAERYRFLGRASEAQIESYHAMFNQLFHYNHRNMSSNTPERMRRSLARASTRNLRATVLFAKCQIEMQQ
jgi:hypothetical protein